MVIFIAAAIAAIMSTVDSALLAISSMVTQDLYSKINPNLSQKKLLIFGKLISWLIMLVAVIMAINLPQTIWQLFWVFALMCCNAAYTHMWLWHPRQARLASFLG